MERLYSIVRLHTENSLFAVYKLIIGGRTVLIKKCNASYSVLRTIGAEHQHNTCEASTPHVRSNNAAAKDEKKEPIWTLQRMLSDAYG